MSVRRQNFRQNQAARARRLRALAGKKAPSKAQIEAALALISPLNKDLYQQLLGKIDVDRLIRTRKEHHDRKSC